VTGLQPMQFGRWIVPVKVGYIIDSNKCGKFKVISKVNPGKFLITFLDTGYTTTSQYTKVKRGDVRDHYIPNKFGVGYLGEMAGNACVRYKTSKSYSTWHNMLVRCYDPNYSKLYPTYTDCSVCQEWLNFSNFNNWFLENYVEGFVLDKDTLVKGNKIYSPETCKFISAKENGIAAKASVMKLHKVVSPKGEILEIFNVSEFCRINNLSQGNFSSMLLGKRNHTGGWTRYKERGQC
jgi:hypothetical protein